MPDIISTLPKTSLLRGSARVPIVRAVRKKCDWRVLAPYDKELLGAKSPDWFALDREPGAKPIKVGRARKAWIVRNGTCSVFVKVFEPGKLWTRWKARLLGSPALREFMAAQLATQRGVPAARALAVGNDSQGRSALITEVINDAVTCTACWTSLANIPKKPVEVDTICKLTKTVAQLFATAHERGFIHRDAHPENILLRQLESAEPSAVFIDLLGARFTRKPVSVKRSVQSLIQFHQYFRMRARRSRRVAFLREYLSKRASLQGEAVPRTLEISFIRQIRDAQQKHAENLARKWDRRLRGDGKYFARLKLNDGWSATVVLKVERRHVFPEIGVTDRDSGVWREFLLNHLQTAHSLQRTPSLRKHPTHEWGASDRALCVDQMKVESCLARGFMDRMSWTLGLSPYGKLFRQTHRLRHRDVRADLILGFAEQRRFGMVHATALIRPI